MEVEGRRLTLSNLDKVLYPDAGVTKADVINYYRHVAPALLPHLRRRAPTLVRAPDGPAGEVFFEKRCPGHAPEWIPTAHVGRYGRHRGYRACLVDDLPALVWVANLAALELHTHQATVDDPSHPTSMVIDLDPGPGTNVLDCARVALDLHAVLDALGLVAVVKTSGGKGLHVNVPLNGAQVEADDTQGFARALGELLAQRNPEGITTVMAKERRSGRVFVDWHQNARFKTTVAPYSLRIRDRPGVSMPVAWEEVGDAVSKDDPVRLTFELGDVAERLDSRGDLYQENLRVEQDLPDLSRS